MALIPRSKQIEVTTAGTRVPVFGANEVVPNLGGVVVQAHTGTVYVGGDDVASTNGIALAAANREYLTLVGTDKEQVDLKKLYIDGAANGDKATVLYFEKV